MSQIWLAIRVRLKMALSKCSVWGEVTTAGFKKQVLILTKISKNFALYVHYIPVQYHNRDVSKFTWLGPLKSNPRLTLSVLGIRDVPFDENQ